MHSNLLLSYPNTLHAIQACMIRYCIAIHSKSGKNFQLTVIYSDLSQPTVASPEGTLQMLTTACAGHVVTNMH